MNKIYFAKGAAMLFAAAALMSACSSDDAVTSYYPEDNVVRVVTNVNAMATRGSFTDNNLNEMGLSIKNAQNPTYTYGNVSVAKFPGSMVWSPERTMLWQNSKTTVDIVAYAPYKHDYTLPEGITSLCDVNDFTVGVQAEQSKDDNSSDLLVYKRIGFVPYTDLNTVSAIPVNFNHALSLLEIQVSFGTELDATAQGGKLSASPISDLVVGGTAITGTCDFAGWDIAGGSLLPAITTTGDAADVAPYESQAFTSSSVATDGKINNAKATYECILLPQTVNARRFSVSFTINGVAYKWTSPDAVTLQGGNKHILKLTVGKDQVVVSGLTVKKWDTTPGATDIETD